MKMNYKELDRETTEQIWEVNFPRLKDTRPDVIFDEDKYLKWVGRLWKKLEKPGLPPWNGRQIYNACQTAAALPEFESSGKLTKDHLDAVAKSGTEFDKYLISIHGTDDMGRSARVQDRGDTIFASISESGQPFSKEAARATNQQRASSDVGEQSSKKQNLAASSSDSEDDDSSNTSE